MTEYKQEEGCEDYYDDAESDEDDDDSYEDPYENLTVGNFFLVLQGKMSSRIDCHRIYSWMKKRKKCT